MPTKEFGFTIKELLGNGLTRQQRQQRLKDGEERLEWDFQNKELYSQNTRRWITYLYTLRGRPGTKE